MDYLYLTNDITPDKLAHMSNDERVRLCSELRDKILNTVSKNGGHLASNLGVVELTVALLSAFDYSKDKIVFDVGHQCYSYKLLTERLDQFDSLRQRDGISGFPRISESKYDAFDTGHSSTSISAALGIARANRLLNINDYVIAVIGDGSFAGGLAFEALNDLGHSGTKMIIILNDNEMSIDKNVSAISKYLSKIRISRGYICAKRSTESFIKKNLPVFGKPLVKFIMAIKDFFRFLSYRRKPSFMDDLGIVYYGPIDGSNIKSMINAFEAIKVIDAPVLVHVCTKKGKGYEDAENNPSEYHSVSPFDLKVGVRPSNDLTFTKAFSESLLEVAKSNAKVVAISAAMAQGTGTREFANLYPDRFFDCGIAEGHCVTFASGLSTKGFIPVVAIYSSFLQRGFDEIIHDVCFMNNHVVFAVDRAGFVGNDGHTHNGLYDLAYFNLMPNMTIMSPRDAKDLNSCLKYAINNVEGPCAIRYSRDIARVSSCYDDYLDCIRPHVISNDGDDYAIISYGRVSFSVDEAVDRARADGVFGICINLSVVKPIEISSILNLINKVRDVFIVEEGVKSGSISQSIAIDLHESGFSGKTHILAIDKGIVRADSIQNQLKEASLDSLSIYKQIVSIK
ncbi:MAG: 1-deoxy-D-xylulose-5-phosphate synthase [Saccharofermentanaceae bacterium]|nr:1-deoxy-D-xylulose-5-phosphate synthase [Clostridiaceae bacterium]